MPTGLARCLPAADPTADTVDAEPLPVLPAFPTFSWAACRGSRHPSLPAVTDAGPTLHLTSGRMAIALALKLLGIGPGDQVLIPAYHSLSMVEPVHWTGADGIFYRIRPDMTVDLEDVQSKLSPATRLLMIVHYFGFPQPARAIRQFCDRRGLMLLEDCAHAWFGHQDGGPLGGFGDYAIASPMKFLAVYDGGTLTSSRHSLAGVKLRSGSAAFQIKAAVNTLERALRYGRLQPLSTLLQPLLRCKDRLWSHLKRHTPVDGASLRAPAASEGGYGFDPAWVNTAMSASSRLTLRLSSLARCVERRRYYYRQLAAALTGVPGGRPLYPELPEEVVPYVFPLWVERPESVHRRLRQQGVPIIRFAEYLWPGVDASVCPVSVELSKHLLQFPCHQELRPAELAWMIERIQHTLATES